MEKTLKVLEGIFQQVFEEENLTIDLTTDPDQIESWDSLKHAILIDAIEKHFEIKFDLMEMISFTSVSDICTAIHQKKE